MYITYSISDEGIGAQYQRIISLIALAKVHNFKYIHKKITVGHNYNNDPDWDDKWDNFFNIQLLSYDVEMNEMNEIIEMKKINNHSNNSITNENDIINISTSKNKLFIIGPLHEIIDKDPNKYLKIIQDDIRKVYDEKNLNRKLYFFDKNKINIAIHIRVYNNHDGDEEICFINNTDRYEFRDNDFITLIKSLKKIYENSDIHIFSQSSIYTRTIYKSIIDFEDINLHIDTDPFDTFHHLCNADILVTAKSSFSYLAGIYNKNKVIYVPFRHSPLDNWESFNNYK